MGTELTDLLTNRVALGAVTNGIHKAVDRSFTSHPMRHLTRAEVKRRFEICTKWFRRFRTENKFSIDRSVDLLTRALRSELDGVEYKPHDRALWRPDDDSDDVALVSPDGSRLQRA